LKEKEAAGGGQGQGGRKDSVETAFAGAGARKDSVETAFAGSGARRVLLSGDPAVNAVNRLGFKYNVLAPLLDVAYNPDDGVFLGLQFRYTVQGFHKEPYKQLHVLSLDHSLATKAYAFKYSFESIHAVGRADLLVHVDIRAPENTVNFFGFGNESVYEKDTKNGVRYYRARYNSYEADMQLRRRLGILSVAVGPALEYFTMDSTDNEGRYIDQTSVNGLNRSDLYRDRIYAGGRLAVVIDNRNDKIMPSRGIFWQNQFSSYGGLNGESHPYSKLNSALALYTSFSTRANLVLATRVGWGRTFGQYEFYEAQTLGALEDLRGYRKYRFTGDEEFFHNFDVRVKLAEFRTYFFPGSLGLQFFNDIGRVWQQGLSSDEWHDGYGGGIWISPLRRMVLSACYAEGTDGGMVLLKLGFQY
jgi:outer membrane protein assembly factor BamA